MNNKDTNPLTASPRKSNQEIFDLAAPGLLKQGKRSLNPDGDCAYRGQDGLKCAIGLLIPDDLYQPGFEGAAAFALPTDAMTACGLWRHSDILAALQHLHDNTPPDAWAYNLLTLAERFNLSTDCIKEWLK